MADSGIHAEVKKLTEKIAKETVLKHPMIASSATWHKQMQDTNRGQQRQLSKIGMFESFADFFGKTS